jgi:hypothetical protein
VEHLVVFSVFDVLQEVADGLSPLATARVNELPAPRAGPRAVAVGREGRPAWRARWRQALQRSHNRAGPSNGQTGSGSQGGAAGSEHLAGALQGSYVLHSGGARVCIVEGS